MIPSYYSLSSIQKCAFALRRQAEYFDSLADGHSPSEVTPEILLQAFADVQINYEFLKNVIENIEQSLSAGHDPHRALLPPQNFTFDQLGEIPLSDSISFISFLQV